MKLIAIALSLLLCINPVGAQEKTYKTGAAKIWTVDSAREEAFREARPWLDVSQFPAIDPNLIENRMLRQKGGGRDGSRIITVFNNGDSYCVTDGDGPTFYYYASGILEFVQFSLGFDYPVKRYKYDALTVPGCCRKGQLTTVSIALGDRESFTFNPDGTLLNHWIGSNCYNPDGSSCGTRKTYRE